jgi:hypothetical protein
MLKHTLAATLTGAALVGGMLVASGGAATSAPLSPTAAPRGCAYPDTVATTTRAKFANNPIKSGKRATLIVKVSSSGSGSPRDGTIHVTVDGEHLVKDASRGATVFRLPALSSYPNDAHVYTVNVRYRAPACSVYTNSNTVKWLMVVPRKNSVNTKTHGRFERNPIRSGTHARLNVTVDSRRTRDPRAGRVHVRVAGRHLVKKVHPRTTRFRLPELTGRRTHARSFTVRIRFTAPDASVFQNDRVVKTLKVQARRRR